MESGSLLSEALECMKEWRRYEEEDYKIFYHGSCCSSSSSSNADTSSYHPKTDCLVIDLHLMPNNNNNNNNNSNACHVGQRIQSTLQQIMPKHYLWHVGGEAGFSFHPTTTTTKNVWRAYVRYGPSCHIDEWMAVAIVTALVSSLSLSSSSDSSSSSLSLAATFTEVENGYSLLGMEACHVLPPILENTTTTTHHHHHHEDPTTTTTTTNNNIYWYRDQVWYGPDVTAMECSADMTSVIQEKLQPFVSFLHSSPSSYYNKEWTHTTSIVLPRLWAQFFQQRPDVPCAAILSIPYTSSTYKQKQKQKRNTPEWNQDLVMTTLTLPKTNFAILASSSSSSSTNTIHNISQTMEWKRMKRTYGSASPHLQHATTYGIYLCIGIHNLLTYNNNNNNNNQQHKTTATLGGVCPLTFPNQTIPQQMQSFLQQYNNQPNKRTTTTFRIPTMTEVDSQDWMILPSDDTDDDTTNHPHSALEQYMMEIVQQQQKGKHTTTTTPKNPTNTHSEQETMMNQLYQDVQSFLLPKAIHKDDDNTGTNTANTQKKKIVNIHPKIVLHMLSSIYNDDNDDDDTKNDKCIDDLELFFTKQDLEMDHDLESQLVDHFSSSDKNVEELHLLSNWLQSLDSQTQLNGPVTNMLNEFLSSSSSSKPE